MLSRGISLIIPLVTCILLVVYTLAFTEKKIQVTRGIFYGIQFESVMVHNWYTAFTFLMLP